MFVVPLIAPAAGPAHRLRLDTRYVAPPRPGVPVFPPTPQQPGPPNTNYPVWGGVQPQIPPRGASPTTPDLYDRPVYPQRQSVPVMGFEKRETKSLKPWVLIIGALVMAGLAFAITRAVLG